MSTTASRPQAREAGTLQGISLVLPITLAVMGVVVLAPDLPQMLAHFKSVANSDYWVPMILTTPALCVAIFSAPAGYLGDRFGRRRLLIASMVVYSLVGTAPLLLDNLDLACRRGPVRSHADDAEHHADRRLLQGREA